MFRTLTSLFICLILTVGVLRAQESDTRLTSETFPGWKNVPEW